MTEAVQVALIGAIAPTCVSIAAVALGLINRKAIGTVDEKVDGNFNRMWDENEKQRKALMKLRGQNSEVIGQLIEKEIEKNGGTKELLPLVTESRVC